MSEANIALRFVADGVVEPATGTRRVINLENVESTTGRLIGIDADPVGPGVNAFAPGDVLFGKLRPYLAKSYLVDEELEGSSEFLVLRPRSTLDSRFLYRTTQSHAWLEFAAMTSDGAKMPRTSWSAMADFELALPPLDQQRRIADFLDDQVARIDNIIATRRTQAELTTEVASSEFSAAIDADFSRYGSIPVRRWITSIEQGWSPLCSNVPAVEGEPAVLKLSAIRNGSFLAAQNKAMLPSDVPDPQYLVSAGQLLMSRANTPQLVGDCAVVTPHVGSLYLPDLMYRVNLLVGEPAYVSVALRSIRVRGLLAVIGRGTSMSMAKIRGDDIRELPVPASPLSVRLARTLNFQEIEQHRQTQVSQVAQSIKLFEEMKRSLITAAVTGEFDVSTADGSRVLV